MRTDCSLICLFQWIVCRFPEYRDSSKERREKSAMVVKGLVASIIQFLTQQLEDGDITADSRESLEVAIQCLESAYNVQASDSPPNLNLYSVYKTAVESNSPSIKREATAEEKVEAERLKNEGNNFMKEDKFQEALQSYTKCVGFKYLLVYVGIEMYACPGFREVAELRCSTFLSATEYCIMDC